MILRNALGQEVVPDDDGWITTIVEVDLSEVIERDLEGFLDLISERATGVEMSRLMQQSWRIVGFKSTGTVLLEVTGDASADLELEAE